MMPEKGNRPSHLSLCTLRCAWDLGGPGIVIWELVWEYGKGSVAAGVVNAEPGVKEA